MNNISIAKLSLLIVNVLLLICGALMMYFTVYLTYTGWMDAFRYTEYDGFAVNVITVFKLVSGVVMVLALIGIAGAVTHQRYLLVIYAGCMSIIVIAFVIFSIGTLQLRSRLIDWKFRAFPATDGEIRIGDQFNQVYCYAHGVYLCHQAPVREALQAFIPGIPETAFASLPDVKGINGLCTRGGMNFFGMEQICNACSRTIKFEQYLRVLEWAQEKCPASGRSMMWCGQFLATGQVGPAYMNSPYLDCRAPFLEIAISWSNSATYISVATSLFAIILVILAVVARQSEQSEAGYSQV